MTRHLARLAAEPRSTGSAGNTRARAYCADVLRELGYAVEERRFLFSPVAGLYGTPIVGVSAFMAMVTAAMLAVRGDPVAALGAVMCVAAVLTGLSRVQGARARGRRFHARQGVNLVAAHAGAVPRVWLVAHIDSKSQPVSILVRATGVIVVASAAGIMLVALLFAINGYPMSDALMWTIAAVGAVGAIPLILSVVGDGSDGAVDNASGVAAVLTAAEQLAGDDRIGLVITDGEELGLMGAYAFAAECGRSVVLNCDTVDDVGRFTVMKVNGSSERIVEAFRAAAREVNTGGALRVMRLIPGILTDSVAFASAGSDSVTLSRGTIGTLARIHTRRDALAVLRGDGIDVAAALLAGVAKTLVR